MKYHRDLKGRVIAVGIISICNQKKIPAFMSKNHGAVPSILVPSIDEIPPGF
jgi:hypothetical protein